jgi:hypothetical protein
VLPALPSNEKNSFDHHNSYNKGPNLACNGLLESPLNIPSTKKNSKNPITNWNRGCKYWIMTNRKQSNGAKHTCAVQALYGNCLISIVKIKDSPF